MNAQSPPEATSLLVVEDSRIQAKILADKLRHAGYHVRTAENGRVGLEMIRDEPPRLVISDIEMPLMTGYELCREIKQDGQLRRIPVILLSTLSEAEDIIKGLHCGADNYVTKPYDPEFLIARVRSLLDTPLALGEDEQQLDVTLGGTRYSVRAGRQQVLNLLVSTFENAVEKNRELMRSNEELSVAKEQLTRTNRELESLNDQLETANARMSHDLEAAAKVQRSLLPAAELQEPRVRVAWEYLPCDELAGDFLNFFRLDDTHVAFFVVDVSGHGVASSLLSVTVGRVMTPQVSSSSLLVHRLPGSDTLRIVPPAEVAAELNRRFLMEDQNGLYFTMAYGILDTQSLEFRYVQAGHDPLIHLPRGGAPRVLEGSGLAIGFFDDSEFDEYSVQLAAGDRLFLYSDGVPEAMDAELNEFGDRQMVEIMELGRTRPLRESAALLLQAVERWCRVRGPRDDVSILGLEIVE